jgi:hypothetical protein
VEGRGVIAGITAGSIPWQDLEEAFSLAIDAWGFDLIEFDVARLRPEGVSQLGLLTQRFGASVGLRLAVNPVAWSPGPIVGALGDLCRQCEDALARYARLSIPSDARPESDILADLDAVLPAYEAVGAQLLVPLTRACERALPRKASPAPGFWLDLDQDTEPIASISRCGAGRIGCVRIAAGDVLDPKRAERLRRLRDLGFRGTYLLTTGASGEEAGLRAGARRLREILGGA